MGGVHGNPRPEIKRPSFGQQRHDRDIALSLKISAERRIIGPYGGDLVGSVVLTAVTQSGYWRVELAWPTHPRRYFGKFQSKKEAEKWIEQHRWLTKQPREPDDTPPDNSNDP